MRAKLAAGIVLLLVSAGTLVAQLAGTLPPLSGATIQVVACLLGGTWLVVRSLIQMGIVVVVEEDLRL